MGKPEILNKTMGRTDIESPESLRIVTELNDLILTLEKNDYIQVPGMDPSAYLVTPILAKRLTGVATISL